MVSKIQKKQQKQKTREKENNKKIREKREKMREPARLEKEERRLNKRISKLQVDMIGLEQWEDETLKKLPEATFAQLEHNAKILRVLEREHEEELEKKRELHEGLEEQGHLTLEDKMDTIRTLEAERQMEEMGVGGNAECKVVAAPKPKRRKKQVAIVEVIKAPSNEEDENS